MQIDINDPIMSNFSLECLTQNFAYYNSLLHEMAEELNLPFFDTTKLFIDSDTCLLSNKYRDYSHHYKGYCDA